MYKIKNLFLLVFCLLAASAFAQTIDTANFAYEKSLSGFFTGVKSKAKYYKAGSDSNYVVGEFVYVINQPLITSIYTDPDTSGIFRTTLDSIPITANSWFDVNAYTSDSTIFLCFNRTFPLHSVIPIPAGSHNVRQYSISIASYGYLYKRTQTRKHSIEKNSY